ncbi:hypothetical protein C8Q76DRAFT_800506 [Earliella scabrosa]|nr:hypothetical protein C8Q76DRAFT_800506 [Earliella scabrosa]
MSTSGDPLNSSRVPLGADFVLRLEAADVRRLLRSATHSNSAANAVNFLDPFQLVRKTADLTVNWQRVEELARNNLQSDSEKKPQRGGARLEWKIDECVADYVRKGLVALPQNATGSPSRATGSQEHSQTTNSAGGEPTSANDSAAEWAHEPVLPMVPHGLRVSARAQSEPMLDRTEVPKTHRGVSCPPNSRCEGGDPFTSFPGNEVGASSIQQPPGPVSPSLLPALVSVPPPACQSTPTQSARSPPASVIFDFDIPASTPRQVTPPETLLSPSPRTHSPDGQAGASVLPHPRHAAAPALNTSTHMPPLTSSSGAQATTEGRIPSSHTIDTLVVSELRPQDDLYAALEKGGIQQAQVFSKPSEALRSLSAHAPSTSMAAEGTGGAKELAPQLHEALGVDEALPVDETLRADEALRVDETLRVDEALAQAAPRPKVKKPRIRQPERPKGGASTHGAVTTSSASAPKLYIHPISEYDFSQCDPLLYTALEEYGFLDNDYSDSERALSPPASDSAEDDEQASDSYDLEADLNINEQAELDTYGELLALAATRPSKSRFLVSPPITPLPLSGTAVQEHPSSVWPGVELLMGTGKVAALGSDLRDRNAGPEGAPVVQFLHDIDIAYYPASGVLSIRAHDLAKKLFDALKAPHAGMYFSLQDTFNGQTAYERFAKVTSNQELILMGPNCAVYVELLDPKKTSARIRMEGIRFAAFYFIEPLLSQGSAKRPRAPRGSEELTDDSDDDEYEEEPPKPRRAPRKKKAKAPRLTYSVAAKNEALVKWIGTTEGGKYQELPEVQEMQGADKYSSQPIRRLLRWIKCAHKLMQLGRADASAGRAAEGQLVTQKVVAQFLNRGHGWMKHAKTCHQAIESGNAAVSELIDRLSKDDEVVGASTLAKMIEEVLAGKEALPKQAARSDTRKPSTSRRAATSDDGEEDDLAPGPSAQHRKIKARPKPRAVHKPRAGKGSGQGGVAMDACNPSEAVEEEPEDSSESAHGEDAQELFHPRFDDTAGSSFDYRAWRAAGRPSLAGHNTEGSADDLEDSDSDSTRQSADPGVYEGSRESSEDEEMESSAPSGEFVRGDEGSEESSEDEETESSAPSGEFVRGAGDQRMDYSDVDRAYPSRGPPATGSSVLHSRPASPQRAAPHGLPVEIETSRAGPSQVQRATGVPEAPLPARPSVRKQAMRVGRNTFHIEVLEQ